MKRSCEVSFFKTNLYTFSFVRRAAAGTRVCLALVVYKLLQRQDQGRTGVQMLLVLPRL